LARPVYSTGRAALFLPARHLGQIGMANFPTQDTLSPSPCLHSAGTRRSDLRPHSSTANRSTQRRNGRRAKRARDSRARHEALPECHCARVALEKEPWSGKENGAAGTQRRHRSGTISADDLPVLKLQFNSSGMTSRISTAVGCRFCIAGRNCHWLSASSTNFSRANCGGKTTDRLSKWPSLLT